MALLTGINHVAVMTDDLDRFMDFYTGVFGLEVVFEEATPAFRHAILRTGPDSWLHPAQVTGNAHGAALPSMSERGACSLDGGVEDLWAFHALWFEDPDGMRVELTVIVDPELQGIHAPVPLAAAP